MSSRPSLWRILFLGVVGLGALFLIACVPPAPAAPEVAPSPTAVPIVVPAPKSPAGTVVIAVADLTCAPSPGAFCAQIISRSWGVVEDLFYWHKKDDGTTNYAEPLLAEKWQLAPDLKSITVTIRKGIQFQGGWGELTAADVKWSYDYSNSAVNPASIVSSAAYFSSFLGPNPVEVLDNYTVRFKINQFDVRWDSFMFNLMGWVGNAIYSKKVFDQKGLDWMKSNVVLTGPYQVQEWRPDDRAVFRRFDQHHRFKPAVENIVIRVLPEETTRVAGMKTGELDASLISIKNVGPLVKAGFTTASTGSGLHETIWFVGNLWDDTNRATGKPLDPHPSRSGVFARENPWVGNPWSPNDANNPPGIDDMEQARLVRQALARAIDRDAINKALLAGLGWPVHIGSVDPKDPNWNTKWEYPYDPKYAEELLDKAGYKRGKDGTRFAFTLFVPSPNDEPVALEVADALSGFWEAIGVKTAVLKYAYAVYRPGLVERATTVPYLIWWDDGNASYPWDWPRGLAQSTLTRGGFSNGFETPIIAQNYLKTAAESDPKKRIQLQNELIDYLHYWALQPGTVNIPILTVLNPKAIKEWKMEPSPFEMSALHKIVPAR